MKKHIFFSYLILGGESTYHKYEWIKWVVNHHEKLDGSGYPCGKREKDLDLFSRILQVADIIVALSEDRPYRKGMTLQDAVSILDNEGVLQRLCKGE